MPIYRFECLRHSQTQMRILPQQPPAPKCPVCGDAMKRAASSTGVSSVEVLDNGLMSRPVERFVNQPELLREKNRAHDEETRVLTEED